MKACNAYIKKHAETSSRFGCQPYFLIRWDMMMNVANTPEQTKKGMIFLPVGVNIPSNSMQNGSNIRVRDRITFLRLHVQSIRLM